MASSRALSHHRDGAAATGAACEACGKGGPNGATHRLRFFGDPCVQTGGGDPCV